MKLNNIVDIDILTEQYIIAEANQMMEMANLNPGDTGLPLVIWVGPVGGQHGPRVKISNTPGKMSDDYFVMTVDKTPVVTTPRSCKVSAATVHDVADWIMLNYDVLMQLWQAYETGTGNIIQLHQQLRKI
jgi:hypothetical protein